MTHHCTVCRQKPTARCIRHGHITTCSHCKNTWVPMRDKECPYCLNARYREQQRLEKENCKESKGKEKDKSSSSSTVSSSSSSSKEGERSKSVSHKSKRKASTAAGADTGK